jgi:hypothetical protein
MAQSSGIAAVSKNKERMEIWWIGKDGSVQSNWMSKGWHDPWTFAPEGSVTTGLPSDA